MKGIFALFAALLLALPLVAQDITGSWQGLLTIRDVSLRVVFNIAPTNGGYTATMDSPDQGSMGIPASGVTLSGDELRIEVASALIVYEGKWMGDTLVGTFRQGGFDFPLSLQRQPAGTSASQ